MNNQKLLLRGTCLLVLLGILTAGLWPFHAPKNQVDWLQWSNGVQFGDHGSIATAAPLKAGTSPADTACGLEIWLQPKRLGTRGMGTILAFYWPEARTVSFALRQWRTGVVVELGGHGRAAERLIFVPEVFAGPKSVLFTVTSSAAGTAVYVDGQLAKKDPNFTITRRDLSGEFIVGNSPLTTYNWPGLVKGIAIYRRELTSSDAAKDFADWTNGNPPDLAQSQGLVARYAFDEKWGSVVHNQVDSATNLIIPERFFILHEQFLERPWDEFHGGWHYWKDVGVNIAGFIPFGFCFCAFFVLAGKSQSALWRTVVLGFATSLTIEVLQAFLPTRDSGMTDLMTNTLGTAMGAFLYRWGCKKEWLRRTTILSFFFQQDSSVQS